MSSTTGDCARVQASATLRRRHGKVGGGLRHGRVATDVVDAEGASQREERHEGDAAVRAGVQDRLGAAIHVVVRVLDAHDLVGGARELLHRHVADADPVDEALVASRHHRLELPVEEGFVAVGHDAQVHGPEPVDAEGAQVVLDALTQLGRLVPREPGPGAVAPSADLRHERDAVERVQRLPQELVDDVGAVVLRRVDVIDPGGADRGEHGERLVAVPGRSEDAGPGELHRPEAHAVDGVPTECGGAGQRHPAPPSPVLGSSGRSSSDCCWSGSVVSGVSVRSRSSSGVVMSPSYPLRGLEARRRRPGSSLR